MNYTSDIQIWKEVNRRLKKMKKDGYHPRMDGAACSYIEDGLRCGCCKRKSSILIGYENQYPKNKDIELCSACSDELSKIQRNKL